MVLLHEIVLSGGVLYVLLQDLVGLDNISVS